MNADADLFINSCYNYPTLSDLYKYATYDALGRKLRHPPEHRRSRRGLRKAQPCHAHSNRRTSADDPQPEARNREAVCLRQLATDRLMQRIGTVQKDVGNRQVRRVAVKADETEECPPLQRHSDSNLERILSIRNADARHPSADRTRGRVESRMRRSTSSGGCPRPMPMTLPRTAQIGKPLSQARSTVPAGSQVHPPPIRPQRRSLNRALLRSALAICSRAGGRSCFSKARSLARSRGRGCRSIAERRGRPRGPWRPAGSGQSGQANRPVAR